MNPNIPNISQITGDNPISHRFSQVRHLQCVVCGKQFSLDEVLYVCDDCGPVGTLDVVLNTDYASDQPRHDNVWADSRFLPFAIDAPPPAETIPLKVGGTPYYPATEKRPYAIKDDGKNPTASFKDRASAMVVHHALTMGVKVVATASTGNAAAALAGICAPIPDIQAVIFVPASAPPAKIAQLQVYGAEIILVDGTYDQAFDLCWQACNHYGWYNRSTGINPFTSEGKKTIAWEIAFSGHPLPDVILVSVGDGSIINGVYKGFADLQRLGWLDRIPRLIGVQASGSDALVHAWENDIPATEMQPRPAKTVADSISAGLPRDRAKALRAVHATQGAWVRVSDEDILAAIPALAQSSGVFAEPAGAAAYAGWCEAVKKGYAAREERVLILSTGSGLKDVHAAIQAVPAAPTPIPPSIAAVQERINR